MRQLIAERGYDAITLADVAAGAGVGRTAVYNHFPDKESVLLAWAHDETDRYVERLNESLDGVDDPYERLAIFLRMQMTELAGHHARLAGVGTALSADGRARMRDHVGPMMAILRTILTDAIGEERATEEHLARLVPTISAITAVRYTVGMSGEDLENAILAAIDFVKHGIGAPQPAE